MSTKIVGLEKLLVNYNKRTKADILTKIVNGGAAIVHGQVVMITPVSTEVTRPGGPHGELRGSISIKKSASVSTKATASVFTAKEYAPHVEFGTVNMAAQSFMHKGIQLSKQKVKKYAKDQVKKAMKV